MKKVLLLIAGFLIAFQGYSQSENNQKAEKVDGPQITFKEESHDFGDIKQGEKVNHTFEFENTGTEPLVLSNVLTTCGCTATNWPQDPIPPGKGGSIEVSFNSAGKMGQQNKIVTIVSNAENSRAKVKVRSNVLPRQ